MTKTTFIFCMAILAPQRAAAQGPGSRPPEEKKTTQNARQSDVAEKMMLQYQQVIRMQMEKLKTTDPKAYQEQKEAMERQDSISKILSDFRNGKLTGREAEKELRPLVKKELAPELRGVDVRIAFFEKKLAFWKQVRNDPNVLIRKRLDEMLGKSMPEMISGPTW